MDRAEPNAVRASDTQVRGTWANRCRMRVRLLTVAVIAALSCGKGNVKRFEFYAEPLAEKDYAAMGARPGWQAKSLEVEPGVTLRGLVHTPTSDTAPWVVFFAGNSGALLAEAQPFLEALRGDRDFGVAAYAYRGFDGSTGTPSAEAFVSDGVKVVEQLRGKKVHLVSFSLGTAIASAVGSKVRDVASVSLLAPMTEIDVGEKGLLGRFKTPQRFETLRYLPDLNGPVLVVHGENDSAFPVAMGREVAKGLGARGKLVELPGVAHLETLKDTRTLEAVRALIQQ